MDNRGRGGGGAGSFRGPRSDTRGGRGDSRGGRGEFRGGRGDFRGGRGDFRGGRGDFRGGRGDFRGGRGDARGGRGSFRGDRPDFRGGGGGGGRGRGRGYGGAFDGPSDDGDPIFESGSVPQPDPSVEAWENQLASEAATDLTSLSLSDKNNLPARPGYGTQGRKIVVRVNFFPLDIVKKDITLYRYELTILPRTGGNPSAEDDATKKMAKSRRRQFVALLMAHTMFKNVRWATDYAKLIITDQKLDLTNQGSVTVAVAYHDPEEAPLPQQRDDEPAELTQRRRVRSRNIRIAPAGDLHSLSVQDLIQAVASGRKTDFYAGKDEIIQAYNIIINNAVLRAPQDPRVAQIGQNKFYPFFPSGLLTNDHNLMEGLQALRGYFSSLRIGANRLLLNVNVASGAFYKPGPLTDLIYEYARSDRTESVLRRLGVFLRGLKVKTDYLKEGGQRLVQVRKILRIAPKPNGGLGGNSIETTFPWQDRTGREVRTNVQSFFQTQHGINLKQPKEFLVDCGTREKPMYIPVELCLVIGGQPTQRLLSGNQTSNMIRFAARPPKQNAQSITTDGLQLLKVTDQQAQQDTHGQWGINIKDKMITVNARILVQPAIAFNGRGPNVRDGMWNLNGLRFVKGSNVPTWIVLYIKASSGRNQGRLDRQQLEEFARQAKSQTEAYGVTMSQAGGLYTVDIPDPSIQNRQRIDEAIATQFKAIGSSVPKPKLVWVIIPAKDVYLKARIKLYGDVMAGVQTMLIQEQNVQRQSPDVLANEAAKMNLRFGGLCWKMDTRALKPLDDTYMLMGIDVTHPAPGSGENAPSVAAVVATIDGNFAQYRGRTQPQGAKVEMVSGLKVLVVQLLNLWKSKNRGQLPKNILVYRDGVSEGQYQDVLNIEVAAIEEAFMETYGKEQFWPNLSLVVVTKRHHVRFFPTDVKDSAGRMNNCKPGTVVDRGITGGGSQLWDTYLQAHQGIQGHARSARYIFLRHGIKAIKVDDFERLTNALCYMWQRAPRSVSYAPPAYYADLLAERGRSYLIRYLNDPEGTTQYDPNTAEWNGTIHADVRDTMFFV